MGRVVIETEAEVSNLAATLKRFAKAPVSQTLSFSGNFSPKA
jgi:hypothetical protein